MTRYLRAELILPLTIVAAAAMLAVSEFMTTFEFTSGGEPIDLSTAADRHSYALLILAAFTVAATAWAIVTGVRTASVAAAFLGCAALLLFLVLDLPDAGRTGPLGDEPAIYFADARADPQLGFFLEAVGSVVLGLATVAFATLRSDQLRAPAELLASRRPAREAREETTERPPPRKPPKKRRLSPAEERAAARERLARSRKQSSTEKG